MAETQQQGPSEKTLRDASQARRFPGLSHDDDKLLKVWLSRLPDLPDELHTHVPIGPMIDFDDLDDEFVSIQIAQAWPRRIDAVVRFGEEWWLIELKPDVSIHALGQVLAYWFWWHQEKGLPGLSGLAVITDVVDDSIQPLFERYGVQLLMLGEVLPFARRRGRFVLP